tara:strand:- start:182 stop:547 length:366 start_codon:yes stop_codon:yes gene_type:complete
MRNAVGFNGQSSMLQGLKGTPNYGKAMAAQAQLDFAGDMANKKSGAKQNQENMMRQQKKDSVNAARAGHKQQYKNNQQKSQMAQAQTLSAGRSNEIGAKRRMHTTDMTNKQNALLDGLIGA